MAIGNVYVISAIAIVGGGLFGYAVPSTMKRSITENSDADSV